jgi:hypothetical protein
MDGKTDDKARLKHCTLVHDINEMNTVNVRSDFFQKNDSYYQPLPCPTTENGGIVLSSVAFDERQRYNEIASPGLGWISGVTNRGWVRLFYFFF